MSNSQPLPEFFEMELWRGDTRVWEHHFNDSPPEWAASTAYVVGTVGSITYLANSTVTHDGVTYTCKTAHTSGATFDATMWTADPKAVGVPEDITAWVFLGQYRVTTEDTAATAVDAFTITDGPNGIVKRTLTHTESAKLAAGRMVWDMQATKADGSVRTYLYNNKLKVDGDTAR